MIDPLSLTSYFIELMYEDKVLGTGTCFFVKRNTNVFLITNWHNVSGQHPTTKEFLSRFGVHPTHIKAFIFKIHEMVEWEEVIFPLYNDDKPIWLEHPQFKEKVDVIAVSVEIPKTNRVFFVEESIEPHNENTKALIKDELFIIGFPFSLTAGGMLPIWKRASIASEPAIDLHFVPKMYVDTASRSGMSGSPVLYKEKRGMPISDRNPGDIQAKMSKHLMEFVGIYSGRIGADDELKAQLGIVWKKRVIDEIINQ